MPLMHITAFSENTGRKQTLTFPTFFLHALWTFMSSKGLWVLSHVVSPEETERKNPPKPEALLLHYSSLCTLPLWTTAVWPNTAAGHKVSGIQTTSELLRESIHHPASPENINGLTQTRLGEGIRGQIIRFCSHDRLVYIRLSSSLFVKILPQMEKHSLIFLFSHYCC